MLHVQHMLTSCIRLVWPNFFRVSILENIWVVMLASAADWKQCNERPLSNRSRSYGDIMEISCGTSATDSPRNKRFSNTRASLDRIWRSFTYARSSPWGLATAMVRGPPRGSQYSRSLFVMTCGRIFGVVDVWIHRQ